MRLLPRRSILRACLLAAFAAPTAVWAAWPVQPIRIVVPYSAGGSSDLIARALATELSVQLSQSVIVDNKPGASAMLGAELVSRAAPDGYTLLLADMPHVINGSLYKTRYDAIKGFSAIGLVGTTPLVLVVNARLPAKDLKEYVALAKARPGQLNLASGGKGTTTDLMGELMKQRLGLFITHIPYKGSGQAMGDVVSGQIESTFATAPGAVQHVKSGTLRALAVTSAERIPALADTPTFNESGVSGLTVTHWFGLLGPAKLPADVQASLEQALARAMQAPALQQRFASMAVDITPSTPARYVQLMEADTARWARVIQDAKIKAD